MEDVWKSVLQELSVPEEISSRWWQQILDQYGGPGRAYHNVDKYLRRKCELYVQMVKDHLEVPCAFVLAMFFQHYEYDTNVYGDALIKNIEHVKAFFKDAGIVHEGLISSVVGLLGAAREGYSNKEGDEAYFQDLELAVLGAPVEEYRQYIKDVEEEYSNTPNHLYRSLRLKLLQTLLLIPKIYSTDIFHDEFETQARENIQSEIDGTLN